MEKSVPDPPPETSSSKADDPLKDRSALYRAIDFYLTRNQPGAPDELRFYNVSKDVSFEDTQLYIADLLRCASVTAYQCGDHLKGRRQGHGFLSLAFAGDRQGDGGSLH